MAVEEHAGGGYVDIDFYINIDIDFAPIAIGVDYDFYNGFKL
jgi:hypothetical protein